MKVKLRLLVHRLIDAIMWGVVSFIVLAGILGAVGGAIAGIAAITLWILLIGRTTILVPFLVFGLVAFAMSWGIFRLQQAYPRAISRRMVVGFWLLSGIGFPSVILEAAFGPVETLYALMKSGSDPQSVDRKFLPESAVRPPQPKLLEKSKSPVRQPVSEKSKSPDGNTLRSSVRRKPGLAQPEIELRKTRPAHSSPR